MKQHWTLLILLAGSVSPALAQERQPAPSTGSPGRTRERTMVVTPEMDRTFYFRTNRGKMGITVSVNPQPRTDSVGALVEAVSPGGPAFKVGLRSGDIITRFNGRSVPVMARETQKTSPGLVLVEVAASLDVGDTARVEYRRGSNRQNVSIVLEAMPEVMLMPPGEGEIQRFTGSLRTPDVWSEGMLATSFGIEGPEHMDESRMFLPYRSVAELELAPMNPGLGAYFGVTSGVLVISAPEGSRLNLRNGDVVTSVDGRRVSSPNQFFRILRSYEAGEEFKLDIVRMKRREVVTGSLSNR